MQKTATKPGQQIKMDPNTGWTTLQDGPSMDQANQFNSSLSPENLYNNYSNAVFGGDSSPNFGQPNDSQTNQQTNSQIPMQTQQVQAQVPDYGPMVQSMQQYVQAMNDLLANFGQK